MKTLVWRAIDEECPETSGYYLVCDELTTVVPRVAYFDRVYRCGDWFEWSSQYVVADLAENLIFHIFENANSVGGAIGYDFTDDIAAIKKKVSEILGVGAEELYDAIQPNLDALTDAGFHGSHNCNAEITHWCEIPKTPMMLREDDAYMAATSIGTQELLSAIEGPIRRVLGGFKHVDEAPPWKHKS